MSRADIIAKRKAESTAWNDFREEHADESERITEMIKDGMTRNEIMDEFGDSGTSKAEPYSWAKTIAKINSRIAPEPPAAPAPVASDTKVQWDRVISRVNASR